MNIKELIIFIQEGKCKQVVEALSPDDISVLDESQCSLLHWAAINNRVRIAMCLINRNNK